MSRFFWKKHGNCWLLGVMWQHLVLLLLLAAGCWQMGNTWKMQENTMKYMYRQHKHHVSKIHEIHKHMLEYSKIEQKTHEKTLS